MQKQDQIFQLDQPLGGDVNSRLASAVELMATISTAHADRLAELGHLTLPPDTGWVVLSLWLTFEDRCTYNATEPVIAQTYLGGIKGARLVRHYIFSQGSEAIFNGRQEFILFDRRKRKPLSPPLQSKQNFISSTTQSQLKTAELSLNRKQDILSFQLCKKRQTPLYSMSFIALPTDSDENGHINNVVYIRWLNEFLLTAPIKVSVSDSIELAMEYLHESFAGDKIHLSLYTLDPDHPQTYYVGFQADQDKRDLTALAKIKLRGQR